ncbi:hypothetical protein DPMN_182392 [Dreissena polymorpha]|uniref:Uncharacterized protein n=1 Tax=Dreissena polymorpha TaxID=45954 RepID=A0A9D4I2J6_DREPO|nr:hypothetical protein DPMN_182392 [Dreissena polymorpha]
MSLDKTLQSYVTNQTGHSIKTLNNEKYKADESPVEYSYQTESEGILLNLHIMDMLFMFVPVIKELIYETLRKAEAEAISKLWLVGDFAQSRYVREALEVEFSSLIYMFYPLDCENAILKGPLIMGKEDAFVAL